jgi:2-(1,2-epoxy-1,2-dihydrophenyl)acetyl-CoA isomerase
MTHYQTIEYDVAASVATIILNRPERRNALTQEMLTELYDAFSRAGADSTIRAILLTGAGKSFCAGQDLGAIQGDVGPERVRAIVLEYYNR